MRDVRRNGAGRGLFGGPGKKDLMSRMDGKKTHTWRLRDCRSARCSEKWCWARAVWGARKKSGWGVSWTTSELSASTPTSGRLQPRTRKNGAERQNKRRNISWQNGSLQKKPRLDYGMQCGMPERDGKDQGEDVPKQAGSCWFARLC